MQRFYILLFFWATAGSSALELLTHRYICGFFAMIFATVERDTEYKKTIPDVFPSWQIHEEQQMAKKSRTTILQSCWIRKSNNSAVNIYIHFGPYCGVPAISLHSHHVSLVQWTTCLLPVTRDPGSNPQGGTYVKPGFSC
jgi:hypothetical protein